MIRSEQETDLDAINRVHRLAFPTAAEAQLVDGLRAAGHLAASLVAELDGEVVGHVALSPVTVDGVEAGLGLAPVAVLPEFQRRGVGSALVREAIEAARTSGAPLVVLLGDPQFYGRFGFVPASQFGLHDTYGGGDAFQAVVLDPDRPPPTGAVHYAPEFAAFD